MCLSFSGSEDWAYSQRFDYDDSLAKDLQLKTKETVRSVTFETNFVIQLYLLFL